MFERILIANRGEIAVRIIRTCKRMRIGTVAIYSEADSRSPYVEQADDAAFIGPAAAQDSYLDKTKVIDAALSFGCQAVHPGYGFLAENSEFAQMVADAGLIFIGPSPNAIALLGDKIASKDAAKKAGVPVIPGYDEDLKNIGDALAAAERIGWPVLLKPAAGGGGRGMRVVKEKEEFAAALAASREETRKSFADDRIFIEKYIPRARHIEIQILGDIHGNIVYLGERECSVQRRHQKVIEETPSPAVDEEMRRRMGAVACSLGREVAYTNAGTVEFILDDANNFYFLEMNTRLQVEHPITELVTSLDLVELQIRIAAGERLPMKQENILLNGWSIEARVCAEDPSRGFLPTTGIITRYALPSERNVRIDSGVAAGSVITIYYDSLLAKVAAWGADRSEAIDSLVSALNGFHIEGVITNLDFVNAILNHPAFREGDLSTNFIEEHFARAESMNRPDPEKLHYMAIAAVLVYHTRQGLIRDSLRPMSPMVGRSSNSSGHYNYVVRMESDLLDLHLESDRVKRNWTIRVNSKPYSVVTPEFEYYRRRLRLDINGVRHMFRLKYDENHIRVSFCGINRVCEIYTPREWNLAHFMLQGEKAAQENVLKCPMPGMITSIDVEEGAHVRKGQELVRMESMKMETGVAAPIDGQVDKVLVQAGQTVETDQVLITFRM